MPRREGAAVGGSSPRSPRRRTPEGLVSKLNRRAVVPTLVDGDKVIPESNVILEYLEDTYPEPRLSPKDPYERAKMRLWTKQLDEDVHDAVPPSSVSASRSGTSISTAARRAARCSSRSRACSSASGGVTSSRKDRSRCIWRRGPAHGAASRRDGGGTRRPSMARLRGIHAGRCGFTPYLLRLEHLELLGMVEERPRVADWYARCQARRALRKLCANGRPRNIFR